MDEKGELGSLREGEGRRIKGGRTRERVLREGYRLKEAWNEKM